MMRRSLAIAVLAALALAAGSGAAQADWSGDQHADVLTIHPDGTLLMYRGNGAGGWITGAGQPLGGGWGSFTALLAPGDWSGDGKPDVLARGSDGALFMYRGNGAGGWAGTLRQQIGAGWESFTALLAPRDFSGDGHPDVLARTSAGALLMYRGDGDGGWITGVGEQIGSGWEPFTALLAPGDFSGDGKPDILARTSEGALLMYRGNGAGGWVTGSAEQIGAGWGGFTALAAGGDFSGDGKPDVLAGTSDGTLLMYRGNGAGGWLSSAGEPVGSGWSSLAYITLVWDQPPPPPPPPPPAPPSAPLPNGIAKLRAGLRCTPPGGRLKVNVRIRRRAGSTRARVRRVVFYIRGGPRKVDGRRPWRAALRVRRPAGSRGRVYARVVFTRAGSSKLRRKTVSRRFLMCR
jgi:hypothetical protein